MKYINSFQIFESKEPTEKVKELIEFFDKEYGVEVDKDFEINHLKLIKKAFKMFDKDFIKNKIDKIICKDLGGVHGRWHDSAKKKQMTLNPSIFKFKKEFENGTNDIPYDLFVVVHEIGHCVDHLERVSYSREWKAISGWKKLDRRADVPDGFIRYEEKRRGREIAGHKLSNWIHNKDAEFCRKYTSRNPREDFADSFAFGVFGIWNKFKGEGGEKKKEIIKKILKKVN